MTISTPTGFWSYFMCTELCDDRINYEHFAKNIITGQVVHLGLDWANPTPSYEQIYFAISIRTPKANT